MSRQLINEYRGKLDRLRQVSGSARESVLCEAFGDWEGKDANDNFDALSLGPKWTRTIAEHLRIGLFRQGQESVAV